MSGIVVSHVFTNSRAKGSALLLLLAIADNAKHDGTNAWPSQRLLAEKTKLSVRQVRRLLDVLVAARELHLEERPGKTFLMLIPMGQTPDITVSEVDGESADNGVRGTPDIAMSATPDILGPTPDMAVSYESSSTNRPYPSGNRPAPKGAAQSAATTRRYDRGTGYEGDAGMTAPSRNAVPRDAGSGRSLDGGEVPARSPRDVPRWATPDQQYAEKNRRWDEAKRAAGIAS